MSILIKDMEIPQNCEECGVKVVCKKYWKLIREQHTRPSWCPLIEIPPHGDLIDREELKHVIGQFSLNWEYGQGVSDCWDALLNAPTIIKAEE